MNGLRFFVQEGIIIQLHAQSEQLASLTTDAICQRKAQAMKRTLAGLSVRPLARDFLPTAPPLSKKALKLLDLLWQLYTEAVTGSAFRGVVFVDKYA